MSTSALAANATALPEAGEYAFRMVRGQGFDLEASDGSFAGGGDWERGPPPHAFRARSRRQAGY